MPETTRPSEREGAFGNAAITAEVRYSLLTKYDPLSLYRQKLKATATVIYSISKQVNTVVSGDESEIHDEPHVRDRRITVSHIHALVEERGLDARTVADRFDLTASDIYHALAYYHDHPEEMRAAEERRRELREAAEDDPKVITGPDDLPES